MRRSRSRLLIQYLISYVLVLAFPILVILVYYYPHSTEVVKQKETDWNAHVTEQFMTSMDTFTRYVYHLPYEIVQNREIKLYDTDDGDYERVRIAGEMRKYNATDGFIDNTLLYVEKMGFLFAKTGSAYKVEDFAKPGIGFYYESWPHEEMFRTLRGLEAPLVRPVENVVIPGSNRVRMLTFALPLPIGGYDSPGAVLILVREETIARMLDSVSEKYTGDFFIFDENGKPLLATKQTEYGGTGEFRAIVSGMKEGKVAPGIHALNGRSYIASYSVSEANGWQYVSVLPVTETLQGIQTVQRNTIVLIGLMLLLEMLVIYVSIRRNYHPIKRLVDLAVHLFEPPERQALSEIETIRYALGELVSVNSTLDAKVKRTLPILRDHLLFELVSGKAPAWADYLAEAKAYGISFPYSGTAVAVLCIEAGDSGGAEGGEDAGERAVKDAANILRIVERRPADGLRGCFFRSIYHQEMIFVGSYRPDYPLREYLESVRRELEASIGARALIGAGIAGKPESSEAVHLAYLQALRASEHLRLRREYEVLFFDEVEAPKAGTVSYCAELLQSLELMILKNDADSVAAVVERILAHIGSEGIPPHLVRGIYLNTVSAILNGLQRFSHDDASLLRLTDAAFRHRYTIEQMADIVRDSCAKLCEVIRSASPPSRSASRDDIVRFIEERGMDPDFSLQRIADRFGMSPSNFSHYFKKTFGQNFKEYIDLQRIQKSARLLRDTNQTLDEVSRQAGFANTSSFIRSFKKIVGTTPGQYRDTHKAV
ncbi:AraC family transcriptional regulator [Cohnella xylanilytica]|uniref:AraC family transcriptional regulator n=1 Tax=Cohnella xylanilytica TaxID=557555 RepID=A0A841TPJ4_9BACL|nr:AraC family transcriptional regulator [Cohnella xylanilytica]MBB6690246.1 AraC family transcriptional regulator [Cohnella xylanilytica]